LKRELEHAALQEVVDLADAGPKLLRGLLEVFLLESLEQQPKHGYALLKEMGETFGAQPNRNRLYPLLAKLVADGYVREVSESGGNRTLFALTDQGHEALRAYRRLPPQFRHALRRIWTDETHPDEGQGRARERAQVADDDESGVTPAPEGALPYPCPDARAVIDKEPRSGALTLRLTGCPMGAYDYCPECPVFKSIQGVKALVLGQ